MNMVPFSFKLEICAEGNMEIHTIISVFDINLKKNVTKSVSHLILNTSQLCTSPTFVQSLPSDYLVSIYWDHNRNQPLIREHLAQGTCNGLQRIAHHASHADEVAIWWIFSNYKLTTFIGKSRVIRDRARWRKSKTRRSPSFPQTH